jgi:hypothetical protein
MGKKGKRYTKARSWEAEQASWEPELKQRLESLKKRKPDLYNYRMHMVKTYSWIDLRDIPDEGHLPRDMRACVIGSYAVNGLFP